MRILLVCALLGWVGGVRTALAQAAPGVVPPHDPCFQYDGFWQDEGDGRSTVFPGSRIRFRLQGSARLRLCAGLPGLLRVRLSCAGQVIWDGPLTTTELAVEAGPDPMEYELLYVATACKGYDPQGENAAGAELFFYGLELGPESRLLEAPGPRRDLLLDFLGDSITAGVAVLGRGGAWSTNSDVALTYAYLASEKLGARYRIRAFPGADSLEVTPRYAYVRKGRPLESEPCPDYVVINLGANARRENGAQFKERMRNLLDIVVGTHPRARIVLLNFFRMRPDRWPALQEVAAAYPGGRVACMDVRACLVDYSDKGVHPGVSSHRLLADTLAGYVLQESGGPPP